MISVVFVAARGTIGGPNQSLLTLCEALDGRVRRILAAPAPLLSLAHGRRLVESGYPLGDEPTPGRSVRLLAAARLAVWTMRHRGSVDVIHANNLSGLNLAAPAAMVSRRPLVVWFHASRLSPASIRFGRLWGRVVRDLHWVAVSNSTAELLAESGLARHETISIIPNPISPAKLVTAIPDDEFTIAYLGGPAPYKGYPVVANVVRLLGGKDLRWRIVAGGQAALGGEPDHATALLQSLHGPKIELLPWLTDVTHVYATANVVFCPSYRESFGLVAAEAMANGIPVVGSDIPAFRELLGEGAGLLFPPGDVAAAAEAIKRLATDEQLGRTLGEEGKRRAEQFTPARVSRAMLEVYLEGTGR